MKKLIVAAVLVWGGAAIAGDYHQSSTLKCSECHTMHASRAHGLQSANANDNIGWTGNPAFPNDKLLIQAGVNVTCLSCHDNTTAPDVFAVNEQGPALGARSAGALNGTVAGHANAGYSDWMGHTLASQASPPGYTGSWDPAAEGFHCGNCHSIHGSAYFRNLGGAKAGTVSQKLAGAFTGIGPAYNALVGGTRTANAGDDIFVTNATARTYATAEVQFRIGTGGMNKYCGVCHGDFHNTSGSNANTAATNGIDFIRHPTTGVGTGYSTTVPALADPRVTLVRPAYNSAAGTSAEAACLSCHKGHGNQRGFGLVYPSGAAADTNLEEGNTSADATTGLYPIRNLCTTCHTAY